MGSGFVCLSLLFLLLLGCEGVDTGLLGDDSSSTLLFIVRDDHRAWTRGCRSFILLPVPFLAIPNQLAPEFGSLATANV